MELTQKELDDIKYVQVLKIQAAIDALLELEGDIISSEYLRGILDKLRSREHELS